MTLTLEFTFYLYLLQCTKTISILLLQVPAYRWVVYKPNPCGSHQKEINIALFNTMNTLFKTLTKWPFATLSCLLNVKVTAEHSMSKGKCQGHRRNFKIIV